MQPRIAAFVAVVLSIAAANLSYNLFSRHMLGEAGPSWFASGCSEDATEQGGANCAAVLNSPYSYWPPKLDGQSRQTGHLPVAFLGLVYYSVLAVWFVGVGAPTRDRRWLHLMPVLLVTLGLAGSAFFTYIMFRKLDSWCPWCLVTHVLNVLIAACVVMMWPGKGAAERGPKGARLSGKMSGHPTWRLAGVTAVAVLLVLYGHNQLLGKANTQRIALSYQRGYTQLEAIVKRYSEDIPTLFRHWQNGPRHELTIGPNDSGRSGAQSPDDALKVVVFSDFECPRCAKVAKFIESEVQRLFEGNLMLVFKHFPLHHSCNPQTTAVMHPHACAAAQMAEAARSLKSHEGFWFVHDYLFEHQDALRDGEITPDQIAGMLQVDPAAFRNAMATEEAARRIREDAELGRQSGIIGTPGVFVAGRKLDEITLENLKFWNRIADFYWEARKIPRPESTLLPADEPATGAPQNENAGNTAATSTDG